MIMNDMEKKSHKKTVYFYDELHTELKSILAKEHRTISEWVCDEATKYIKKHK